MDWPTVLVSLAGSAIVGPASVGLFNFLSTRSIEQQKGRQSRELLEAQNVFSVGATSHMATVAFDKHIGFCEEYIEEVSKALEALIPIGNEQEPLDPGSFSRIRRKWALWLTNEIDTTLERYEGRITQIGGEAPAVDADGHRGSNETAIKDAIAFLRKVLRTEELTALRNKIVAGP